MNSDFIYLDHNATTPLDERVLQEMMPFLTSVYGNAASTHRFGKQAKDAVDQAREQVADLIGAESKEIIFTSGATEGINLAMKGLAAQARDRRHIITLQTEHSAVIDTAKYLEDIGFEMTYLPVQENGLLDVSLLREAIRADTLLVSVMYVNNETGVIQPIQGIAAIAHEAGAYFMTDATQAVGKLPLDVENLGIDLLTLSAHKFYGPKGVGALYVRRRNPFRARVQALLHGGGHERGMRSGTLNVPGIVGLGAAAHLASEEMENDAARIGGLRDDLEARLLDIGHSWVNGSPEHRLWNISNIGFRGVDADALMMVMKNIAVSNGSACTSMIVEPSHVLRAMGLSEEEAFSSIRFSLGRGNTMSEIEKVVQEVRRAVEILSAMA
ncbi:MAG: cysteine desulfurase family protein [Bacteroidota bacterium]